MIKYYFFIILGIILYLLSNLHEKFEAVGECNCRDSDDQPIYSREECEFVEEGVQREDMDGLPCVYTELLQYMHDNVMVEQRVCERDNTSLRCMVQFYDSVVTGSCQINTLYLYYLFIGFLLTRDDIEWLNKFNFNLANPVVYLYVNNYLLNRPSMRDRLYSLRLNPNMLNYVNINVNNLKLHNLYQVVMNIKVNTEVYKPYDVSHIALLYIATIEESRSELRREGTFTDIFEDKNVNDRCIWFIDGCNKIFILVNIIPSSYEDIDNPDQHIIDSYTTNNLITFNFVNRDGDFQRSDGNDISFTNFVTTIENDDLNIVVAILKIETLREDESIPEGEIGFIDKACIKNNDGTSNCNNISDDPELPLLTCETLRGISEYSEDRCVISNYAFQYCRPNDCIEPNFQCFIDGDYGTFEDSFYHKKLRMSREAIDSDIAKSNPKCLPITGEHYRPCRNNDDCNDGLLCVPNSGTDRLGNRKLPICRNEGHKFSLNRICAAIGFSKSG